MKKIEFVIKPSENINLLIQQKRIIYFKIIFRQINNFLFVRESAKKLYKKPKKKVFRHMKTEIFVYKW